MTNKLNKGGFTLIELLVVVLIIGILSSIALPQYTKAVEKARASEAMAFMGDWVTAQTIYKMANGGYAPKSGTSSVSTDLDITLPTNQMKYFKVEDTSSASTATLTLTRQGSSTSYTLVVTMTNNATDGSDTITRTCTGNICQTIISGLSTTTGSGGTNGQWTKGS